MNTTSDGHYLRILMNLALNNDIANYTIQRLLAFQQVKKLNYLVQNEELAKEEKTNRNASCKNWRNEPRRNCKYKHHLYYKLGLS